MHTATKCDAQANRGNKKTTQKRSSLARSTILGLGGQPAVSVVLHDGCGLLQGFSCQLLSGLLAHHKWATAGRQTHRQTYEDLTIGRFFWLLSSLFFSFRFFSRFGFRRSHLRGSRRSQLFLMSFSATVASSSSFLPHTRVAVAVPWPVCHGFRMSLVFQCSVWWGRKTLAHTRTHRDTQSAQANEFWDGWRLHRDLYCSRRLAGHNQRMRRTHAHIYVKVLSPNRVSWNWELLCWWWWAAAAVDDLFGQEARCLFCAFLVMNEYQSACYVCFLQAWVLLWREYHATLCIRIIPAAFRLVWGGRGGAGFSILHAGCCTHKGF